MSEELTNKKTLERNVTIDFARGFAMFVVLMTHLGYYWLLPEVPLTPVELQMNVDYWVGVTIMILLFPFQLLGSWASIFAVISGASVSYTMFYQIYYKKVSIKKRVIESIISAIILLGIHFIYTFFFLYPTADITGLYQQGLIPGSIKNGELTVPHYSIFFFAGPLAMIAFSDLFVSLTAAIIWKPNLDPKVAAKRTAKIFLVIGIIIFFIAEPLKMLLLPELNQSYEEGRYFEAMILTWLIGNRLPIFPFVGYAYFGAIFVMLINYNPEDKQIIRKYGYYSAIFFLTLATVMFIVFKMPDLKGLYYPMVLNVFNLGLQLLIGSVCLTSYDYTPVEQRKHYVKFRWLMPFRRLSMVSLSIFFMEETLNAILIAVLKFLLPSFMDNVFFCLFIIGPLYLYAFCEFVAWWEKYNYKYSIEWFLACILKGKPFSTKDDVLGIEKFIYQSSGFKSSKEFYALKEDYDRRKERFYKCAFFNNTDNLDKIVIPDNPNTVDTKEFEKKLIPADKIS